MRPTIRVNMILTRRRLRNLRLPFLQPLIIGIDRRSLSSQLVPVEVRLCVIQLNFDHFRPVQSAKASMVWMQFGASGKRDSVMQ